MTTTQVTVVDQIRTGLTAMTPQFAAALPKHVAPEKFVRVVMTAVQMNPDLVNADRRTLYAAASRAAQQGLLPDGREGAIVTFGGKAQWMSMVAGLMKLVRNSGEISTWSVQAVYANDHFDYELGDNERIVHRPAMKDRGDFVGAYSIVTMKDGEKSREFMGVDEINAIRQRSRSGSSGPWKTDYAEMAKKTVIRRHSKRLPMSTDLDPSLLGDDDFEPASQESAPPAAPSEAAPRRRGASRLDAVAQAGDVTDVEPNDPRVTDAPADTVPHDEESPI